MENSIIVTTIKSCLTGKVVWLNGSPTKGSAKKAFARTRTRELLRVRSWLDVLAHRKANIMRFLNILTAPTNMQMQEFPVETVRAARRIAGIANTAIACDDSLYNHIKASRQTKH